MAVWSIGPRNGAEVPCGSGIKELSRLWHSFSAWPIPVCGATITSPGERQLRFMAIGGRRGMGATIGTPGAEGDIRKVGDFLTSRRKSRDNGLSSASVAAVAEQKWPCCGKRPGGVSWTRRSHDTIEDNRPFDDRVRCGFGGLDRSISPMLGRKYTVAARSIGA